MEITLSQKKCVRCGHRWFPKPGIDRPQVCPKCHSKAWDRRENLRVGRKRGSKNRQLVDNLENNNSEKL